MGAIERLTITLPVDMAGLVKGAVEGGDYASSSEVIREALRDWKISRGLRLAHRDRRSDGAAAVQPFEQYCRAAIIDDGDGDEPLVLLRLGFAGGHHLVTVVGGQSEFLTHDVSSWG